MASSERRGIWTGRHGEGSMAESCCLELLFEVVCSMAFESVIITDGTRVVACNSSACEMFNYPNKEALLLLSVRELIDLHFEPTSVVESGVVRAAREQDLTLARVQNENSLKKAALVHTKAWTSEGSMFYTISIRDIPVVRMANERRLLQPKLGILDGPTAAWHQTALFSNLAQMTDALPSLIWIVTTGGEVLYQNARVMQVFGVDTTSDSWQECFHPSELRWLLPAWMDGLMHHRPTAFEVRYRHKFQKPGPDGSYAYRHYFLQNTPIPGTNQVVCCAVDIQDLKDAEAERQRLLASERLAVESNRLKSSFLSMMSHEIRTPLFGVLGNVSLLKDTPLGEANQEFVSNIEGSARLMMAVIQDILDFSCIEAGKMSLAHEPFSFNRALAACGAMAEQAAIRKGLGFRMLLLASPVNAVGDPVRIMQILNNVVSNAIKFTNTGSVTVDFEHAVAGAVTNATLIVSDTGIGFGPEMQAQMFTPWVQADSTNQRLYGGSGLGLAITKALLDMMGGTIAATSEPGVGSRFMITLCLPSLPPDHDFGGSPAMPTDETKFQQYLPHPLPRQAEASKRFRILLAEDIPLNQAILNRFIMKMEDVACTLVADGQAALDEYLKHPPRHFHIVLLDQSMPRMDGDTVCRRIRALDPKQIIISVSANALLADFVDFSAIGLDDHIPKPVEFAAFKRIISHWLAKVPELYSQDH